MKNSKLNNQVKCSVAMYHYVRDAGKTDYPEIKAISIKAFEGQLNFLQKNFQIITLDDYLDFLNNKREIPVNSCILTFDDGLKDHFQVVFPILKKKGLTGVFFTQTEPLVDFKPAIVHQVHFLLAKIGHRDFAHQFNDVLRNKFPELCEKFLVEDKDKKKEYPWDNPLTASLKYNISVMPLSPKKEIIQSIFQEHFPDGKEFCSELYMNFSELKEMAENNMIFGAHSHSHSALSCLRESDQRKEISCSKNILENHLAKKIKAFSYPYNNFNQGTIEILKELGFACAFTTNKGVNIAGATDAFTLKRFDAKNLLENI